MADEVNADCLFCKIVAGDIPATLVLRDETLTAFRDINPQASTHVLVIPNKHVASTEELTPADDALVGRLVRAAKDIAHQEGLSERGYRIVFNTGRDANNTVPHLHLHLIGGRAMSWPPG
jgi:histidine triad (HIT) family protein